MKCSEDFKDITYGSVLFCEARGMDIALNPLRARQKGRTHLYCCEDCAAQGKRI